MNYHKIEKTSIANGEGVRVVLWVSGCSLHCKGCHNPQTWDFNSGKLFDKKAREELFNALSKPYIQGITFSGGHPLEPQNRPCIFELLLDIRIKYPYKNIWLYTGFDLTDEDFFNGNNIKRSILGMCDVVIDGAYVEELRDISLPYCGSKNQRLIDVKQTLKNKTITLYK